MSAALPPLVLALLVVRLRLRDWDLSSALLAGAVLWGALLVAMTELLSAFSAIDRGHLALSWSLAVLVLLVGLRRRPKAAPAAAAGGGALRRGLQALLATTLAGSLTCALASPPNNWDSMTYHLARVMHWAQDRSLEHFPTWVLRQIFFGPGAELPVLHLWVLSGGDRLVNLVQWSALAGCVVAASAIAREMGATPRGRWLAAVFAATVPMGILQASSTQNDLVLAFWLATLVYFLSRSWKEAALANALLAGLSLGLALLTKGTAYVYAPALVLVLGGAQIVRQRGRAAAALALALPLALLLNAGHYARNARVFGNPLGPVQELSLYRVSRVSAGFTLSNLLRNAALHLRPPSRQLAEDLEAGIERLHAAMGVRIDDRRSTWSSEGFSVEPPSRHEDHAGCGLHLLLAIACAASLLAGARSPSARPALLLALAVGGAALSFSALLKWQLWNQRLHLVLFMLAAAPVGVALERGRHPWRGELLMLLVGAASLDCVFFNELRPLVGPRSVLTTPRLEQYFAARPELLDPFVARFGSLPLDCDRLGLRSGQNEFEYPVWILARQRYGRLPRLEHVGVENASSRLARRDPFVAFAPCATLTLDGRFSSWARSEASLPTP